MKLTIVVREELKLRGGKLAAQVAHASVECSRKARKKVVAQWYREGQKKVVLKIKGLRSLQRLKKEAERRNLATALITDAGLTQLPPGTTVCLGIGPGEDKVIDDVTGGLKLV